MTRKRYICDYPNALNELYSDVETTAYEAEKAYLLGDKSRSSIGETMELRQRFFRRYDLSLLSLEGKVLQECEYAHTRGFERAVDEFKRGILK